MSKVMMMPCNVLGKSCDDVLDQPSNRCLFGKSDLGAMP
jgi:hypothetical protein